MTQRHPRRPLPRGIAGLGDNTSREMGVSSTRGMATTPGAPMGPQELVIPGLPDGLLAPPDQVASTVNLRKMIEALNLPNMSIDHIEKLIALVEVVGADLIQKALAHYSVYSQVKVFANYDVYAIPIVGAAQAVRLDVVADNLRNRRALVIFNPSATDVLWVGKTDRTAALNGIPVTVNNGSYMVAAHERLPHFGFCANNNTAIIAQYA